MHFTALVDNGGFLRNIYFLICFPILLSSLDNFGFFTSKKKKTK